MTSETAASRPTTSIVVRAIVVWAIALAGFQVIVRVFHAGNWAHIVRDLLLFRPTAEADSWEPIALSLAHLHAAGTHAFYAARYFATDSQFIYSPLALLLFEGMERAGVSWSAYSALNLFGCLVLLAQAGVTGLLFDLALVRYAPSPPTRLERIGAGVIGAAGTIVFYPAIRAWELGQIQLWINCALLTSTLLFFRGSKAAAGALFATACVIKPHLLVVSLLLALRREFRFLAGLIGVLLVLLGASVFAYGWEIHAEYLNLLGYLSRRGESFYANQSLNGLLNRALGLGPNLTWDGTHTHIEFNRAVYLATTVFSFVVLGLSFWRLRRQRPGERLEVYFPLALLAATIASPVAYEHHFGFTLPLFWILFLEVSSGRRAFPWRLAAFTVVLAVSTNFWAMANATAPTALNFLQSYLFFSELSLLAWLLI